MSSVKNFQLGISPGWYNSPHGVSSPTDDEDREPMSPNANPTDNIKNDIILQFGKVAADRFTMDVQYPLSVYQVCRYACP